MGDLFFFNDNMFTCAFKISQHLHTNLITVNVYDYCNAYVNHSLCNFQTDVHIFCLVNEAQRKKLTVKSRILTVF